MSRADDAARPVKRRVLRDYDPMPPIERRVRRRDNLFELVIGVNGLWYFVTVAVSIVGTVQAFRPDVITVRRETWMVIYASMLVISLTLYLWWRGILPNYTHERTAWKSRPAIDTVLTTSLLVISFIFIMLFYEWLVSRSPLRSETMLLHLIANLSLVVSAVLVATNVFMYEPRVSSCDDEK